MHHDFKPFDHLITYEKALEIVLGHVEPINRFECLSICDAYGRVLAEEVYAKIDMPPFTRAAMDGYALISSCTVGASKENPKLFKVIGTLQAGEDGSSFSVAQNTCVEVATGAELPLGADAVVRVEDTKRIGDDEVLIFVQVNPMTNVSEKGYDKRAGELLFNVGEILDARKICVLAASGNSRVKVFAKPKITILPTGDEIVEPEKNLPKGCVYDSSSYLIYAIAMKAGCQPVRMPPVRDSVQEIRNSLIDISKSDCDMIVMIAGSSVGRRDFSADILSEIGDLKFRGMRTRPGMPTLFAIVNGKPVIGMPGHPVSCFVVANVLLLPALRKLSGVAKYEPIRMKGKLVAEVRTHKDFHSFITVRLEGEKVVPVFRHSDTTSTIGISDGYIEAPIGIDKIDAGSVVEVKLFEC
jgi:molybdenum cofactor synthesis domain-containing protein